MSRPRTTSGESKLSRIDHADAACSLLSVALLWAWSSGCAARQPTPPPQEAVSRYAAIRNIAILPPEVELDLMSVGGGKEPLTEEAAQAAKDLVDMIGSEFAEQGRKAGPVEVAGESNTDPEKLFRDVWIRQSYERIGEELGRPLAPALVYSGFSLGESTKNVALQMGADGLLFVKCKGHRRTGGSVAGELLTKGLIGAATAGLVVIPEDPIAGIIIGVALVDGKTGDLLWANRASESKFGFAPPNFDKGMLGPLVKTLFKTTPK